MRHHFYGIFYFEMAFSMRNLLIVVYIFPLIEFNGNVFCRAQFVVNATQSPTNITMQSGYFFSKKRTKSSVISNQCGFHNFFIPGDGDFPWLALILYKELGNEKYTISCNGNLISSKHILTAGDCVKPNGVEKSIHQMLVIIGNYDVQRWLDGKDSRNYTVKIYDVHPEVATSAFKWELAVITLTEEVQFKTFIRPICLWSGRTNLEEIEGNIGMTSGWRISHDGEILTPKSTETTLSVIPQEKCLRTDFLSGLYSPTRTFCTENKEGSKLCTDNGNSSGTLGTGFMIKRKKRWFLRGFFSMGTSFSCELSMHQSLVFIDVSPFTEWILYTMLLSDLSRQVPAANGKDPYKSIKMTSKWVQRREWVATPPEPGVTSLKTPVPLVVLHHTATEDCLTLSDCIVQVRYIQKFHMESSMWSDIAYNFLVGSDGNIYEGRGWTKMGAHTKGYNNISIGIAFIGLFDDHLPPDKTIRAAQEVIRLGVELKYIQEDYQLLAMRQLSSFKSPGQKLYENIKTWPHWSATPSKSRK